MWLFLLIVGIVDDLIDSYFVWENLERLKLFIFRNKRIEVKR